MDINQTGQEWARGWPIIVSALVGIALCLSPLPFYTLGVLGPELTEVFGWTRPQWSFGYMCMTVGVLLGAPIAGYLTDKYGARRVVLPSIICLGLGMMAFSLMNGSLWVFYGIFLITSILSVGTLPITWSKAIVNNFDVSRGLALGVALTGTGIFGFVGPRYTRWLIDEFGWRGAYIGIGMLPLILSFTLAYFLFRDPKEQAAMTAGKKLDTSHLPGLTMTETFRDYRFYLIFFAFLIVGAMISGILGNAYVMLTDKGYSPQMAASLWKGVGLIGAAVIAGRFIGGILVDYIWAPAVAFIFMSMPAIACYILMQADASVGMNSLALILTGFAAGVEYDLMAFLVSRYMGMKSYGKIYAWIYIAFGLGSGTSPAIYNLFHKNYGSYKEILTIAAFSLVIGAGLLLFLGRYRNFEASTHT